MLSLRVAGEFVDIPVADAGVEGVHRVPVERLRHHIRVRGRVGRFRLFGSDCGGVVTLRPVCGGHDLVGCHLVASVARDHGDGQHVQ